MSHHTCILGGYIPVFLMTYIPYPMFVSIRARLEEVGGKSPAPSWEGVDQGRLEWENPKMDGYPQIIYKP